MEKEKHFYTVCENFVNGVPSCTDKGGRASSPILQTEMKGEATVTVLDSNRHNRAAFRLQYGDHILILMNSSRLNAGWHRFGSVIWRSMDKMKGKRADCLWLNECDADFSDSKTTPFNQMHIGLTDLIASLIERLCNTHKGSWNHRRTIDQLEKIRAFTRGISDLPKVPPASSFKCKPARKQPERSLIHEHSVKLHMEKAPNQAPWDAFPDGRTAIEAFNSAKRKVKGGRHEVALRTIIQIADDKYNAMSDLDIRAIVRRVWKRFVPTKITCIKIGEWGELIGSSYGPLASEARPAAKIILLIESLIQAYDSGSDNALSKKSEDRSPGTYAFRIKGECPWQGLFSWSCTFHQFPFSLNEGLVKIGCKAVLLSELRT